MKLLTKKTRLGILCFLAGALLLSGCAGAEPIKAGEHPPVTLSAWTVYWDAESSAKERQALRRKLASVSCFTAAYRGETELFIPEETRAQAKALKKNKAYLSIVNDWWQDEKHIKEKDRELLARLFADEASMDAAIADILKAAKELSLSGVELDYENFWKDKTLSKEYLAFTYRLARACTGAGLDLRIVLEPSAPMDADFAKGPTYVVMLYNLYGKHSGPGPKADGAFIRKTIKKMEKLPGNKGVAFSTGGCLWEDYGLFGLKSGKKRFITEQEAVDLQKKYQVTPERDPESAALHYLFTDDKGKKNEVWYADSETLNAWITVAANEGITDISIWRLGSNVSIQEVKKD